MILPFPLDVVVQVGKVIGVGKSIKNITDVVAENSAVKRKERELRKQIEELQKRSIFETAIMYIMAAAFGGFICSLGVLGFVLTAVVYLSHCNNLYELRQYTNVKREIIFTAVLGLIFLACFF